MPSSTIQLQMPGLLPHRQEILLMRAESSPFRSSHTESHLPEISVLPQPLHNFSHVAASCLGNRPALIRLFRALMSELGWARCRQLWWGWLVQDYQNQAEAVGKWSANCVPNLVILNNSSELRINPSSKGILLLVVEMLCNKRIEGSAICRCLWQRKPPPAPWSEGSKYEAGLLWWFTLDMVLKTKTSDCSNII